MTVAHFTGSNCIAVERIMMMQLSSTSAVGLFLVGLIFWFMVGMEESCAPPPSVYCEKNQGCQIFNWDGIWEDRKICSAANAAWPRTESELLNAVATAVKNKQKIRVVSAMAHSFPKLVCVESMKGLIISTQNYDSVIAINKTAMTIAVQAGAMMGDVIEEAAKAGLALPAMINWNGVSAAGVISTGAHGSSLAGRGSGVYEYVVAIRMVVPASRSEGYAKVATMTETDEELKAARLSLGTLGAISEITFALEPMFKRSVSAAVKDDFDLENEAGRFLKGIEFGEINWVPSHGKAVFLTSYRVPVDVPGNGFQASLGSPTRVVDIETSYSQDKTNHVKEDVDAMCNALEGMTIADVDKGSGFLNDQNIFKGYPVVGFNHRIQSSGGCQGTHPGHEDNLETCTPTQILDKNETVCVWDRRLHTTLYFDVELRVPLSRIREAIEDIKNLRRFDPFKFCGGKGILIRSIKKSEAYLGPREDMVTFELISYRPREAMTPTWNEDVYEEIEQMFIEKYGGELHWGKSGGYLFQGLANKTTRLEKFLRVKEIFDPHGVFSNEWTNQLFGIGGRQMEDLGNGCALEKMCKCTKDTHCAPNKGYFCKPGRVWNKARVCRKQRDIHIPKISPFK